MRARSAGSLACGSGCASSRFSSASFTFTILLASATLHRRQAHQLLPSVGLCVAAHCHAAHPSSRSITTSALLQRHLPRTVSTTKRVGSGPRALQDRAACLLLAFTVSIMWAGTAGAHARRYFALASVIAFLLSSTCRRRRSASSRDSWASFSWASICSNLCMASHPRSAAH